MKLSSPKIRFENDLNDIVEALLPRDLEDRGWVRLFFDWAIPIGVCALFILQTRYPLYLKLIIVALTIPLWRLLESLLDKLISPRWIASLPIRVIVWINARQAKGVLGEHTLEITESGLVEETSYNRTETPWERVGPIETRGHYTLVFITPVSAHVVPHNRVIEGDIEPFLEEVRRRAGIPTRGQTEDASLAN